MENINLKDLLSTGKTDILFNSAKPFARLMMYYNCAMLEIKTKLDVLNNEMSLENDRNPFESITCRLKSPKSIFEKLQRKGYEISEESIVKNLNDVAGIRVICSFPEDIYKLAIKLCAQDDIRLIDEEECVNEDGNYTNKVTRLKGQWIICDMDNAPACDVYVSEIERNDRSIMTSDVKIADDKFSERFCVRSDNPQ